MDTLVYALTISDIDIPPHATFKSDDVGRASVPEAKERERERRRPLEHKGRVLHQ
jgi:hypothetical protein